MAVVSSFMNEIGSFLSLKSLGTLALLIFFYLVNSHCFPGYLRLQNYNGNSRSEWSGTLK